MIILQNPNVFQMYWYNKLMKELFGIMFDRKVNVITFEGWATGKFNLITIRIMFLISTTRVLITEFITSYQSLWLYHLALPRGFLIKLKLNWMLNTSTVYFTDGSWGQQRTSPIMIIFLNIDENNSKHLN